MPRRSVTQKMQQVVTFLIGLRHRAIREALAPHGLTREEIAAGWRLVSELGDDGSFEEGPSSAPLIAELDRWENLWSPIADAALSARMPEMHAVVFQNLRQTSGIEVVVGVRTFLERIDAHPAARTLLVVRGLSDAKLDEARALIARIEQFESDAAASPEPSEAQEESAWRWYREWSAIARVVLSDRRHLNALGFSLVKPSE